MKLRYSRRKSLRHSGHCCFSVLMMKVNHNRFIAILKQITTTVVATIERDGIPGQQSTHESRKFNRVRAQQ
ncbi:MAG: hypothetical protein L3J57_14420 [Desulfuromusa sp.]|nr:hypothetical protein [Desulfuromusa sp.]